MKAAGLYRYLPIDHPESLLDLEEATPAAAGHDLLVAVRAISVNPVDCKRRAPKDLVEQAPKILGWDAAGIVQAAGPEVTLFKPGDARRDDINGDVYAGSNILRNWGLHIVDINLVMGNLLDVLAEQGKAYLKR